MVFLILCVLSLSQWLAPETVKAGEYDNAYTYYQRYGHEMAFLPGNNSEGEIYYATQAKKDEHTGTKYTTLGWKIRVFNGEGALVETLYYKLGGSHMTSVDIRTVNGYEYCLYRVTLSNIRQRLSQTGLKTLENPNCNIIFDACTTTKLNGVVQGAMTDAGPSWGSVYTTYNGIVNAQKWSNATKQTLKSYYNKNVAGLFYDVMLQKGTGIQKVYGTGRYCFGTLVTVSAEVEDGYHFTNWSGSSKSQENSFSFRIPASDITLTALARENIYHVKYESDVGEGDIPIQSVSYNQEFVLPTEGFLSEDARLSGWTISGNESEHFLGVGQNVAVRELVHLKNLQRENDATIVLKAVWDQGPRITTEHIYVSKGDALAGRVTEEWLSKRAQATDLEDGEIPYGKREGAAFFLEGYQASRYTKIQGEQIVQEQFFAVDSAGNTTRKSVAVHIVDTSMYPAEKFTGRVRFISEKYFKDENGNLISEIMGGLAEDSIWRLDENYRQLLEQLFP